MKEPYFKWSYVYRKNLFDLFMKRMSHLEQPFNEADVFSVFKKMTGQKIRSKTYNSFKMILADEKVQIKHEVYDGEAERVNWKTK